MAAWQLRPRRGLPLTGAYRNPRFSVLKARVGIFWEGDIRYYRVCVELFTNTQILDFGFYPGSLFFRINILKMVMSQQVIPCASPLTKLYFMAGNHKVI